VKEVILDWYLKRLGNSNYVLSGRREHRFGAQIMPNLIMKFYSYQKFFSTTKNENYKMARNMRK
jgi:uncharacterized protein (DUF1330 family)